MSKSNASDGAKHLDTSGQSQGPWRGQRHVAGSDTPFYVGLCILSGVYILLLFAMLAADALHLVEFDPAHPLSSLWKSILKFFNIINTKEIRFSIRLSLISCTITTILSLLVSIPIGYLMSRHRFPGRSFLDALLDIPIVLPPLVIGLSLLILFHFPLFEKERLIGSDGSVIPIYYKLNDVLPFAYSVGGVILSQFMVACAFAVRTMRATFDQIDPRREQVALTLGCRRSQAFWQVVVPQAHRGILTAATLAWARSMGEFGPILIFAGATRMKTEVLPTTVFLEMSVGNIDAALAVSLLMVFAAILVLLIVRIGGHDLAGVR